MRILYIDIDSLRPDHLGCYGYRRNTSPNIDALAAQGAVVKGLYASDSPCLPSRTAFFGGKFGTQTGVINHGGVCADLQPEGKGRDFRTRAAGNSLASLLTRCGYWTASVSPFPRRHSAYQMTYGFNETIDTGRGGLENADEIFEQSRRWLNGRARDDNWFLHVNMWDPHTPYDTPASFGNPFENEPIDKWITEKIIAGQRESYGPHSAREVPHYDSNIDPKASLFARGEITNLEDAKVHMDGYDCGVRYADEYVGRIVNLLDEAGVLEETAIVVAADHGENLGELNVWGDHQTADEFTNHIPGVIRWPGVTSSGTEIQGLYYHLDLATTIVDLASLNGAEEMRRAKWEGIPIIFPDTHGGADKEGASTLPDPVAPTEQKPLAKGEALVGSAKSQSPERTKPSPSRNKLFLSQGAWSLQRSARWENYILIHTVDTGMKDFSEWMLFDLVKDPHETNNLAGRNSSLVGEVGSEITDWFARKSHDCPLGDPFNQVLAEGGPYHARVRGVEWGPYLKRLEATGRVRHAEWLRTHGNAPRPRELAAY